MRPTVTEAEDAPGFDVMGTRITPIATGADTGGWEMFRLVLAPGGRSPLHTLTVDKIFAVTGGTVRLTVGDGAVDLSAGGFAQIPAGTPHDYANLSDASAKMIGMVSGPTSQIEFLRGMSELSAHGRPDPTALGEHTARHSVRLIAPAPA